MKKIPKTITSRNIELFNQALDTNFNEDLDIEENDEIKYYLQMIEKYKGLIKIEKIKEVLYKILEDSNNLFATYNNEEVEIEKVEVSDDYVELVFNLYSDKSELNVVLGFNLPVDSMPQWSIEYKEWDQPDREEDPIREEKDTNYGWDKFLASLFNSDITNDWFTGLSKNNYLAKDLFLPETKNLNETYANDFKTLEIISEAIYKDYEYDHSILYVGHDGGRDLEEITTYENINEISNLTVAELFADYIDSHL